MGQFCVVRTTGSVLHVTIDRQDRRNALSSSASHELGAVFDEFERDPACRVAVLTGAGGRAFCAGADLKEPGRAGPDGAVPSSGFGGLTNRFNRTKPVIAAVNGAAMGGGFELALACDLVIAVDHATFGLPEARVGLAALSGGIQRLINEIGPTRARGMLLTGRHLSARDGLRFGFVNEVVAAIDLADTVNAWCDEVIACSPASIQTTLAIANAFDGRSVEDSMNDMWSMNAVQELYSGPDAREGTAAFAERRTPTWSES